MASKLYASGPAGGAKIDSAGPLPLMIPLTMMSTFRKVLASGPRRTSTPPGDSGIRDWGGAGAAWRALADAMPDAVLVLDNLGTVIHANAAMFEVLGNVRLGQPVSHTSRSPELIEAVDRVLRTREPMTVQVLERVPVERSLAAAITAVSLEETGQADPLPALLVTFRDLTEQDKLARMRADFVANASHELRTPLASLRGFVETLQGPARDDPEARSRFLAIMASQAERMTRLIDDLLSLSRVEMRAHLPPKGVVDLNEVAAEVAQALEPLARSSQIDLRLELLDAPARVRADREELLQVLQNLVHNAVKYGRKGGFAALSLRRVPGKREGSGRIAAVVADDGPGIAAEHLPRLTERFYRVNVATSREKGGTGLGLAIVKHIVNRHRGELKIESSVGQGSAFTVILDEAAPAGKK